MTFEREHWRRFQSFDLDALAAIAPEMVGERMVSRLGDAEPQPARTFDASPLPYMLINAVKELAQRVEALEGRAA